MITYLSLAVLVRLVNLDGGAVERHAHRTVPDVVHSCHCSGTYRGHIIWVVG